MFKPFKVALTGAVVLGLTTLVAPAAHAAYPTATLTGGQAFVFPSSVEFDWTASNVEAGTTVELEYVGCGGETVIDHVSTADESFTVSTVPGDLGSDWTRTITISQPGMDTYVDTVVNTDPSLQFECASGLVESFGAKHGKTQVGETVYVDEPVLTDAGQDATVTYLWDIDGVQSTGSASRTFTPADQGKYVSLYVQVSKGDQLEEKGYEFGQVAAAPVVNKNLVNKWGVKKGKAKVNRKVAVTSPKLTSYAKDNNAKVVYAWKVGGKTVSHSHALKLKKAWKNKSLKTVVKVVIKGKTQGKTYSWGKIKR